MALKIKQKKITFLTLAGFLLLLLGVWMIVFPLLERHKFGVLDEDLLIDIPLDELPEDALYISYDRRMYQRGDMTLIIPAIDVFTPVGESTELELLEEMPGLYEFANMPGEGNVNTSIAGHRDIYDMVFYSLDKVQKGDYLYLLHNGMVYRYAYLDSVIVRPNDWSLIMPQGFSALTLTTCDPIGTTWNRLIVRGELLDVQAFDDDYRFVLNQRAVP